MSQSWTFGPQGGSSTPNTATWSPGAAPTLTDAVTSGGAFVAQFGGQAFANLNQIPFCFQFGSSVE